MEQKQVAVPKTQLTKVADIYLPMIQNQLEGYGIELSNYQKECALNAISTINNLLESNGLDFNSEKLDKSNVKTILQNVTSLQLNPLAQPREVYFQLRNVKDKNNNWIKSLEMGIEGDGNDALVRRFGVNIKTVCPYWVVRENDEFEYPAYKGLEITPPIWKPRGAGKIVRIVYPIILKDDTVHFYIGEREDVKNNLLAHIRNNMMNETFGICQDRYKATPEQKAKIEETKKTYLDEAKELGLEVIHNAKFDKWISPSWKDNEEAMIIRKIRNNITKKIPKDFGSSFALNAYIEQTDETYKRVREEVIEVQASEVVEMPETVSNQAIVEPKPQTQQNILKEEKQPTQAKQEQMEMGW
ncbi:MAG: hypothetical protein HFF36_10615 [Coprobacillus sp.]|nr:hypothetical protein [Coprobacillus sp.]